MTGRTSHGDRVCAALVISFQVEQEAHVARLINPKLRHFGHAQVMHGRHRAHRFHRTAAVRTARQLILWLAPGASNEGRSSPLLALAPLFLGPGFRLGARWNRLVETVKTRKKTGKNGEKMGEIRPKTCEQGRDRRDQLAL